MPAPSWDTSHWSQTNGWSGPAFDVDGVTPIFVAQSGQYLYGDLFFTPTGGWDVDYRPTSVVIDMVIDPLMDLADSYFSISDAVTVVSIPLLGASFPLTVDITGLDGDITLIGFEDVHGDVTPCRIDSVEFFSGPACGKFWTNYFGQVESDSLL